VWLRLLRAGVKWDIDLERGMLGVWEGDGDMKKIEDVTAAGEPLPPISQRIGNCATDKRAVRPPWPTLFDEWRGRWPSPNPIPSGLADSRDC